MPEGETTETTETTDAPEGGAPADTGDKGKGGDNKAPTGGEGKTYTQAELDAMIAPLQAAAAELQTIKDSEKTELQREREAREAAEKRAEKVEFERLRERVANRPGKVVPVASLTGKTEAELIASADALIAWRDENAPKPPEPKQQKRNPAGSGGGFKSGATGADSGSSDPKVKAAEALRRLRSGE
ncbi:scaffolding protein [Mycobacterium phage Validus]|uniref:Scaffolding protein n=1 Tax=Mycobacterium phage Validus TaxID=1414747 RepID=V5URI5_9CAUD|nr:head scaffolding protein [Mycobacterium phage Validus]AHB79542.1 scaffolding protein [Mycobacterium phage Validus]